VDAIGIDSSWFAVRAVIVETKNAGKARKVLRWVQVSLGVSEITGAGRCGVQGEGEDWTAVAFVPERGGVLERRSGP
jgi:hypothetical protein